MLLQEITTPLRYTNTDGDRMFWDYFAMHELWRRLGSESQGSFDGPPYPTQARQKIIDQLYTKISETFADKLLSLILREAMEESEFLKKVVKRLSHARKVSNLWEIYAAVNDLFYLVQRGDRIFKGYDITVGSWELKKLRKIKNISEYLNNGISPIVANLIKSNLQYFGEPEKKQEVPPVPVSAPAPVSISQPEIPKVQEPEKTIDLPTTPSNVPPLGSSMAGQEGKRLTPNWEKLLDDFKYFWDEPSKSYYNSDRNVRMKVLPNNSVNILLPNGQTKDFPNLGVVFRRMIHNRNKRHGKEPVAQVTENNYKELFNFLYN